MDCSDSWDIGIVIFFVLLAIVAWIFIWMTQIAMERNYRVRVHRKEYHFGL